MIDLIELKKLKANLETNILSLVDEFCMQTDTKVIDIVIDRLEYHTSLKPLIIHKINVKLEL